MRHTVRAGLLCLMFCMPVVCSARAEQGGAFGAPVIAAPPDAGTAGDPASEPIPIPPLPQANPENISSPQTVPYPGPRSPNALEGRLPSDEELVAGAAVIGEIVIRNENIFDTTDPREDNWLFRLVNTLHPRTRPWLIRKQLLFRTGDAYDRRVLDESERILRSNRYFYEVRIRPVAFHEGRVDVEVLTRDVWTLRPGISFGRQGGANTTSLSFSDFNLFGTGVGVRFSHASTPDRTMDSVSLASTNFAGTRLRTGLLYSENSDGWNRSALLERPFYALDTRWAAGGSFVDDLRVDTPVGRVGVASEFQTHAKKINAWGGWSPGLKGRWVKRFMIGFTQDESRFAPAPGNVPTDPVPPDRNLVYPWIGFELLEDAFEKAKNRDQIERTEDFFLGTRFRASLGYSSNRFGADRDSVVFGGQFGTSIRSTDSLTVLVDSAADGRLEDGTLRDTLLNASGHLYMHLSKRWLLFSTLSGTMGVNLDPDHELLLGGQNGLRGYPRNYQAGDRSALFTLEGRYFSPLYLFRLVRVGGAVFYDMGRAWGGDYVNALDSGILRDVGFGLRATITRSGLGNVIHLDLAFPLDGDPTISRVQYLVTTKQSF